MKKLIEKNVIQINYENFVNLYKKYVHNEEGLVSDKELYEHFIINHLSYSRPAGCLPSNYLNIKEGYLKGINIFEIIEYVNISERMFKCYNDIEDDDLSKNIDGDGDEDGDTDEDQNSEKEEMFNEEEENNYHKGKRNTKKKRAITKETQKKISPKKQKNKYSTNNNFNKCKRVFRFLLYDGKRFIYAYEDEFNEQFNYLDNEEYEYPKILLYNRPIIRSGILLIRKNQASILFKGYKTQYKKQNKTVEEESDVIEVQENVGIINNKQHFTKHVLPANNINMTQPNIKKEDDVFFIETDEERIPSSYFKKEKNVNTVEKKNPPSFITSHVDYVQKNSINKQWKQEVTENVSNCNIKHDTSKRHEENKFSDKNTSYENNCRMNIIANFDNEERRLWEKNREKQKHGNGCANDIKNVYPKYNLDSKSCENMEIKNCSKEIHQVKVEEKSTSHKLKTNEEIEVIDLTADFFNSDFFISAVGSENTNKSDDIVVIKD